MPLPLSQPVPVAKISPTLKLRIIGAAGAGFPSSAQDWANGAHYVGTTPSAGHNLVVIGARNAAVKIIS
jgi:hypothetical protein